MEKFASSRIQFISHNGKQILFIDLSNCSATEVERIVRAVPEYIITLPRASVLIRSDFTGASLSKEAILAMKESAVFDKPYVKKSAWVGADSLPEEYQKGIRSFSRREFPRFKNRQEALDWLAKD